MARVSNQAAGRMRIAGAADNCPAFPSITEAQQARAARRPYLYSRPQRDMPRRDSMRGERPGVVRLSLTSLLHVSRDRANPFVHPNNQ